jgi:hypothetical protein
MSATSACLSGTEHYDNGRDGGMDDVAELAQTTVLDYSRYLRVVAACSQTEIAFMRDNGSFLKTGCIT